MTQPQSSDQPVRTFGKSRVGLAALLLLLILPATSCVTSIEARSNWPASRADSFNYAALNQTLQRFVDEEGGVDYDGLKREDAQLEEFYSQITAISPHSHAGLFPTRDSKLAYWINSYNAAVLTMITRNYPIESVADVPAPWWAFFLPSRSGFFYFNEPIFGGEAKDLFGLERDLIRPRFEDPRIHFALNCGSGGCPRLPRSSFPVEGLGTALDREARRFFAEDRNLFIDHEKRSVRLSAILDWYREDFTDWLEREQPGGERGLLDYAALYADAETAAELSGQASSYALEFAPYDWSLNDSKRTGK